MTRRGALERAKYLYDLSDTMNDESVKLATLREALSNAEKANHNDLMIILKRKIEYIEKLI